MCYADEGQGQHTDNHDGETLSGSDSDSASEEEKGSESEARIAAIHALCAMKHADSATTARTGVAQEDESEANASTSSSDDDQDENDELTSPAVPPTCDAVRENTSHALSADQRKQLRSALKEQLEDLKVQQAAQSMDIMGL